MRFVFLDNDTKLLFATAYDGDWDPYIDDFATKITDQMDVIFSACEGWPGIRSPKVKDWIVKHQIPAEGWYVAHPDLTVRDIHRLKRVGKAVDEFLDNDQRLEALAGRWRVVLTQSAHRLDEPLCRCASDGDKRCPITLTVRARLASPRPTSPTSSRSRVRRTPQRTVLGACVFPSAGEDAMFSNAIDYSIAVRRVIVAGVGTAAKFQPGDDEIRFSFRFEILKRDDAGQPIQRGVCTLPDGRKLSLTVNDENGASTPEGDVRVFAGLRSDPFYLAWDIGELKKLPNLLQHTNVLCMVVELDTRRVLDPAKGSLFGAIAETVPISQQRTLLGPPVLRIDWVGRPEQTNMRLNNPAMSGIDDIRDLWNQQTPFAIPKELQPLFLQRLKDSFATWDMLDGKADWTPEALAANANVFLDDFLLFDVAKPITDQSHLEIEKSTIERPSLPDGRRPHGRCELDRHPAHLAGQSRSRVPPGRAPPGRRSPA